MGRTQKSYDVEFKQDAVNHYFTSGNSMQQVAHDLKVKKSYLPIKRVVCCFVRFANSTG